jgi:hypothetical protein
MFESLQVYMSETKSAKVADYVMNIMQ